MKDKVIPLAYLFNGGYLQDNGHTTAPMPTAALAEFLPLKDIRSTTRGAVLQIRQPE